MTLRDRVKETLAAREPTEREAARDLDAVLARAQPRRRVRPQWAIAFATAAAVVALYIFFPRPKPPPAEAVHLYVHVSGEPEENALTLDLGTKGSM